MSKRKRKFVGLAPDHPLFANSNAAVYAGKRRTQYARLVLWEKLAGEGALCHWCGRTLGWTSSGNDKLCTDHLDGDSLNDEPENLVPACPGCNSNRMRWLEDREFCKHGHRLTDTLYTYSSGRRFCRACAREQRLARLANRTCVH